MHMCTTRPLRGQVLQRDIFTYRRRAKYFVLGIDQHFYSAPWRTQCHFLIHCLRQVLCLLHQSFPHQLASVPPFQETGAQRDCLWDILKHLKRADDKDILTVIKVLFLNHPPSPYDKYF
jgi:hypothetical protein